MYSFEPRRMIKGWFHRTLANSLRLSLQTPFLWLLIYGGTFSLSLVIQQVPVLMLLASLLIVVGTALAHSANTDSSVNVKRVLSLCYRSWIFIALSVLVVSIHVAINGEIVVLDGAKGEFPKLVAFGFSALLLIMMICGLASLTMLLSTVQIIVNFIRGKHTMDTSVIGAFSLHLTIDKDIPWIEASRLSSQAVDKNLNALGAISFISCLSCISPLILGILIPWIYCIYQEIFFGKIALNKNAVSARLEAN